MASLLRKLLALRVRAARFAIPLLVVYWIVIFVGTHTPKLHVPIRSISDKFLHFTAFCGLSFLLSWSLRLESTRRKIVYAALLCVAYGIFDELTQLLVRNRSADPLDFLADCCGMVVGACLYVLVHRLLQLASARIADQRARRQIAESDD